MTVERDGAIWWRVATHEPVRHEGGTFTALSPGRRYQERAAFYVRTRTELRAMHAVAGPIEVGTFIPQTRRSA